MEICIEIFAQRCGLGDVGDMWDMLNILPGWSKSIVDYCPSRVLRRNPDTERIGFKAVGYQAIGVADAAEIIEVAALTEKFWLVRIFIRFWGDARKKDQTSIDAETLGNWSGM